MRTLLLLLFPTLLFAQNCKYEKNEVDKFTQSKIVITKKAVLSAKLGTILCQGISVNEITGLRLTITVFAASSINEGDKFMIIDDQDSVITLLSVSYTSGNYHGGAWSLVGRYGINDDQISHLLQRQIKSIRVYTSKGYIESNIKEKHAILFQKSLGCI